MSRPVLVLLPLLLLSACSSARGATGPLANTAWQVIEIDGQPAAREARLAFAGNRLSASAGCNTMSGEWRPQGKRLVARQLITTEMYCAAPQVMEQEQQLATLLSGLPRYELRDHTLQLRSGGHTARLKQQR